MRIALTSVYGHDPNQAFSFYTDVLGFVNRLRLPEASLAIVASLEDPHDTGLLLEPNDNPIAKTYQQALYAAGLPSIVFGVDDIHAENGRLPGRGVVFWKAPTRTEWGFEALFEDGCGNLIQIHQVLA
jgi:predicted enzyme related to lactoylglutathione lyase